jgi:hypothetical protein
MVLAIKALTDASGRNACFFSENRAIFDNSLIYQIFHAGKRNGDIPPFKLLNVSLTFRVNERVHAKLRGCSQDLRTTGKKDRGYALQ